MFIYLFLGNCWITSPSVLIRSRSLCWVETHGFRKWCLGKSLCFSVEKFRIYSSTFRLSKWYAGFRLNRNDGYGWLSVDDKCYNSWSYTWICCILGVVTGKWMIWSAVFWVTGSVVFGIRYLLVAFNCSRLFVFV